MFSGIVEETATVVALVKEQENLHLTMKCKYMMTGLYHHRTEP